MVIFTYVEGKIVMKKFFVQNKLLGFSVVEAVLFLVSFLIGSIFYNIKMYEYDLAIGSYHCYTSIYFDHDIVGENGTVYPAGTEFEVYVLYDNGGVRFRSLDDEFYSINDSNHDYMISDAENYTELLHIFNELKQSRKNDCVFSIIKFICIGIVSSVVFFVLMCIVNNWLKNRVIGRWCILITLSIICLLALIVVYMVMSRML